MNEKLREVAHRHLITQLEEDLANLVVVSTLLDDAEGMGEASDHLGRAIDELNEAVQAMKRRVG